MEINQRYKEIREGDTVPLSLDCYRKVPGSRLESPMALATLAATAAVSVRALDGTLVVDADDAAISSVLAYRFEYEHELPHGEYLVWWRVRLGAGPEKTFGPFDLRVGESPFVAAIGAALNFNVSSNSGLLSVI